MLCCSAAQFLLIFVLEALRPDWQALDFGEFLEINANCNGRRRLFWLVFGTMALKSNNNKMVIERIFSRWASE
jgi:hypothetical protein